MRHLLSLVLSIVLAPLIYFSSGLAVVKIQSAHGPAGVNWTAAGIGVAAAVVAGCAYAILVMARLSPIGPVLAGLGFLGVALWALIDAAGFASAVPSDVFGQVGVGHAPAGAGSVLLAVPLLITIFSPRRWRRAPTAVPSSPTSAYEDTLPYRPGEVQSAAPAYHPGGQSASPHYGPPSYASPQFGIGPSDTGPTTVSDRPSTTEPITLASDTERL